MRHSVTKISVMACGDKGKCARMHHSRAHSLIIHHWLPTPRRRLESMTTRRESIRDEAVAALADKVTLGDAAKHLA